MLRRCAHVVILKICPLRFSPRASRPASHELSSHRPLEGADPPAFNKSQLFITPPEKESVRFVPQNNEESNLAPDVSERAMRFFFTSRPPPPIVFILNLKGESLISVGFRLPRKDQRIDLEGDVFPEHPFLIKCCVVHV